MSWTGPAVGKGELDGTSRGPGELDGTSVGQGELDGPAEAKVSWTGPTLGGALEVLTHVGARVALTLVGTRVALTLVVAVEGTCEVQAPECAGEEQAPEGAGEEQAPEGAGEEQVLESAGEEQALGLGSKPSPQKLLKYPGVPGGARVARNWPEPVETKTGWAGPAAKKMSWAEPAEDTSGLPFAANGDGLVLAADSGRLPANAGLGELQTPVISILFQVDYSVTVHTGIQERGDEDCDKQGI